VNVKDGERGPQVGLVSLLVQLNKAIHRRSTEEMLGMRLKAYMTLGYIRDHPGATQQELETALVMDANSVVLILNELEAAQFSVRRRDPQDRRRHIVGITSAGERAMEKADRAREELEDEICASLSAEERTTLGRLMERVLESALRQEVRA
jgi:DNA-binding MarR family transcriptional regulator